MSFGFSINSSSVAAILESSRAIAVESSWRTASKIGSGRDPPDTYFIESGSPWQNGHNESFNGVLRDGSLNRWAFASLREARLTVESWPQECNEDPAIRHAQSNHARSGPGAGAEGSRLKVKPRSQTHEQDS